MSKENFKLGMSAKKHIGNAIIYVILIVMCTVWLIPFVCIVLQSFRVESTWQVGYVVPQEWGLDNYLNLLRTPKELSNDEIVALIDQKKVELGEYTSEQELLRIAPNQLRATALELEKAALADGKAVEDLSLDQVYTISEETIAKVKKDKSKVQKLTAEEIKAVSIATINGRTYEWFKTDFTKWYTNTLFMSIVVAIISPIMVLCMSYTLSRFRFKLRKPLMKFMLILGLFPGMLTLIILYRVLKDIGLTQANAVPGLILVYVASSGMGYYVTKGFFDTISISLDEAARVDGATRAQVLFQIIFPLSKPIVIYTVLTAFLGPWGDFVMAKFISFNTSEGMNVAVGLYRWLNKDMIAERYTQFCAGGVLVAIPVTILFICFQKYYVEGVTGGAVKG